MSEKPKAEAHIFYVDSRFERMARRPGGVARDQAVSQAQAEVEKLDTDFSAWLNQEVDILRAAVAQIESKADEVLALERADTACSQLRDVGGTMGYMLVTFVANSLCTIFDAIKQGAAYDKESVDCHIDALLLVKTAAYRNLHPDQVPEMTHGLRQVGKLTSNGSSRNGG